MSSQVGVTLEIDSRLEEVTRACLNIKDWCHQRSLPRLATYHIELCLDEILNNLVEHHYDFEPGHNIRIDVQLASKVLTLKVCCCDKAHDGSRWVPQEPKLPRADLLEERGWGCYLVHHLMSSVDFRLVGNEEQIIMTKNLGVA